MSPNYYFLCFLLYILLLLIGSTFICGSVHSSINGLIFLTCFLANFAIFANSIVIDIHHFFVRMTVRFTNCDVTLTNFFVTSCSVISISTFAFVVRHCTNTTIFTTNCTGLIFTSWSTISMRTRAKIVANTYSSITTLRLTRIFLAKSSSHSRGAFTFERGHATPSILATRMAKSCLTSGSRISIRTCTNIRIDTAATVGTTWPT